MSDLHKARLWKQAEEESVQCFLCAHRCRISEGKRGVCRVRVNRGGELYTMTYGKLISANADPIEKKPLFHFLPGTRSFSIATEGCNFQCDFCQNWQISQVDGNHLAGRETPPLDVVAGAKRANCASIAYTYTEPTIFFEYAEDCAKAARNAGLKNCFVTNGYQTPETIEAMAGLIDAANVDVKAFNDAFYRSLCKARLEPVKETVRLMRERGILVEVTTLVIPGQNDDPEELKALAGWLAGISPDIPWHVSRFHPDYRHDRSPATPAETIFRAIDIGKAAGLRYIYAGNLRAGDFEHTFCHACGEIVIRRSGFWVEQKNLDGSKCGHCGVELPIIVS